MAKPVGYGLKNQIKASGQWAVGSGQWAVGSGQWAVGRKILKYRDTEATSYFNSFDFTANRTLTTANFFKLLTLLQTDNCKLKIEN